MSMVFDTCLFGVIRPASGSCDERGKWLKSEPELQPEPELKSVQDLELSDFAKEDKKIRATRAKHKKRSRNPSPFDGITPPRKPNLSYGTILLDITDERRLRLTPLCKFALEKYNVENQGANYVFAEIVKTTWRPGGWYYITFQAAEQQDPPNCRPVTIFQAQVQDWKPPVVMSCAIKPT